MLSLNYKSIFIIMYFSITKESKSMYVLILSWYNEYGYINQPIFTQKIFFERCISSLYVISTFPIFGHIKKEKIQ